MENQKHFWKHFKHGFSKYRNNDISDFSLPKLVHNNLKEITIDDDDLQHANIYTTKRENSSKSKRSHDG